MFGVVNNRDHMQGTCSVICVTKDFAFIKPFVCQEDVLMCFCSRVTDNSMSAKCQPGR